MIFLKKNKVLYSIFIKKNFQFKKEINELNSSSDSLQNLIILKKKGDYIKPHFPKSRLKTTKQHNEVLIVMEGSILVKVYANNKKYLDSYFMKANDIIIFLAGYHSVEILKKSKLFEVKPGPFDRKLDIPERFNELFK
tara:strand:- start:1303 stop:1716 length:414 start_codon:yes stop_codon:yes gene_type:complete